MRCTFIPPYVLTQLSTAASDAGLRDSSAQTLRTDQELRRTREAGPHVAAAASETTATRVIHTADHTEQLPGATVRSDGDPDTGDVAVDEAFASSGQVLDMFAQVFNRRSFDGQGTTLSVTVHYGTDYDNAFWDGSQLVFGDGDGQVFGRFTKPFDVMAHEFTHGVTQYTAKLSYSGQPGALNESVSDVFASINKQRAAGQTADQADWLIGEGLFLPGVHATALRSLKAPGTAYDDPRIGKDPQVATMADYVDTAEDSGGVHTNSGIPNHAFYLAATAIGGDSWEAPGHIWYDTLTSGEIGADTDFVAFAQATVSSARRLFPGDASIGDKLGQAWGQVGVLDPSGGAAPDAAARPTADPAGTARQTLFVRRTGGVTGVAREALVDLADDPKGPALRRLLDRVDLSSLPSGQRAGADRFTYAVDYGDASAVLAEHELTPELRQAISLAFED